MVRRYLAVWFPFLPTDRMGVQAPLVVVDKVKGAVRIVAVSAAAGALGLAPGLSLADARARYPGLDARFAESERDGALLARAAVAARRFAPGVMIDAPHGLMLDVTGAAHLLGGEARLRARVLRWARRGGLGARVAIAGTPDAARAVARFAANMPLADRNDAFGAKIGVGRLVGPDGGADDRLGRGRATVDAPCGFEGAPWSGPRARAVAAGPLEAAPGSATKACTSASPVSARAARWIVAPGGEAEAVRPLPIAALRLDPATATALARAGLRTVGDVADRPASALASRFGSGLVRALDRTLGREDARVASLAEPRRFGAERRFAEPVAHLDTVRVVLAQLVAEVGAALAAAGLGGRVFVAGFDRSDGAVRTIEVVTSLPVRDAAPVMRLLDERLDALADPLDPGFGFDRVWLSVPRAEPLGVAQPGLEAGRDPSGEAAELVDRLAARLGTGAIGRLVARDTHWPERAVRFVRAGVASGCAGWAVSEAGAPPARPTCLLARPEPVDAVAEVPDGPPRKFRWRRVLHEVVAAEGPERIAPEWWRGSSGATRDYYRVEDAGGRRFWLFREGLFGGEPAPRWFVHGLFG